MYSYSQAAGVPFKAVSFGSGAQSLQALVSGKIEATLLNPSEAVAMIERAQPLPKANNIKSETFKVFVPVAFKLR